MSVNSNDKNNGEFVEVDLANDEYSQYYEKYSNTIKNIKNIKDVVDPTYVYRNEKTIDSSTKKEKQEKQEKQEKEKQEEKEKEEKEEEEEKEYVLTPEEKEMLLYYEIEQEYYATLEFLDGQDDYGYGSNYNGGYDSY
uniref:Uncharacterized protein n=1 Tax=viral metagenome TaxID=1070528 RepID=A0A6C0HZ22_9ZZZZ